MECSQIINHGKGSRFLAQKRRLKTFELYEQGYSYRKIAKEVGVSHNIVGRYIKNELDFLAAKRKEIGEKVIEIELKRLDSMLEVMKAKADAGDQGAVDRVIRIMDRRARYLGLNAPDKVVHDVSVSFSAKIDEGMARVNAYDPDIVDAVVVEEHPNFEPDPEDIPGVDTK